MFDRILIANRGEIACRVIRTARRMGVSAVAVYSDADAGAQHVLQADEAVRIGPAPAAESYLRGERIVEAALETGAQAIHPGYGFLSENADFAEACAAAGVKFIGPPAGAIRAMGSKSAAKALMEEAKVPIVPGYHGDAQDAIKLQERAAEIGFPVLIKASAGGGGKGMRRVDRAEDFAAALESAQREAAGAFGDDRMLIEKFVESPRHIEIQIFADSHGNAVHLFERDCSIQRRHQKVVEEAPAPGMTETQRAEMGATAVNAARAIGYEGAGTVEFIVGAGGDYHFMEMNTRLQVEHPVTEMITGQDLVEWQMRVAAGEPLALAQEDLAIAGHAIEVRLYAEDPDRDFLPRTGTLKRLRLPTGAGIRCDSGVTEGDSVTAHYDPMIAKLIAWSADGRAAALRRIERALAQTEIVGLENNRDYLQRVIGHSAFVEGHFDTSFIETHREAIQPSDAPLPEDALACAALAIELDRQEKAAAAAAASTDPWSPWHLVNGWRLNHSGRHDIRLVQGDTGHVIPVAYGPADYVLNLASGPVRCAVERDGDRLRVQIGHRRIAAGAYVDAETVAVWIDGRRTAFDRVDPLADVADREEIEDRLVAPMSGKVIRVIAEAGAEVEAGEPILVLEAMKMEQTIVAPGDGIVGAVHFRAGDQVEEGAQLVDFERKES
ncbi:MAG: acetyl/propionyl/methylcrotonyl-CoA carboxylase subunit alpha [Rhodospirillaceae bacterium]|nr:acetyl/propionyl/methylcrotonyl-CoA carboxylase subunit alpha [Rhodospirillaceae bacterium]